MIDIIVVEDMEWMREALVKMLKDYPEYINITGAVSNGEDALKIIAESCPHIVITDISMPGVNGLELSQKLRDEYPKIKVLLVSGYDEFEYARKAIQLKVDDYLLKPINKDTLFSTLTRIISEIKAESRQMAERKDMYYKLKEADHFLMGKEICEVLESSQDIQAEFIEKYFRERHQDFVVMVLKAHKFYKVIDERYSGDIQAAKFCIKNIVENLHNESYYFVFSVQKEDECILIRYGSQVADNNEELSFAKRLKTILEQYTCMRVSVGISEIGKDLIDIKRHYKEACYAIKYRLLSEKSSCYEYADVCNRVDMKDFLKQDIENVIYFSVYNGEKSKLSEIVDELFKQVLKETSVSFYSVQNLYTSFVQLFNRLIIELGGSYTPYRELRFLNIHSLDEFEDLNDMRDEVHRAFETLTYGIMKNKSKEKESLIEQIKAYLNEHYAEDISLEKTARMYFINPSYLSQLFKNETNQTFSQYVLQLRMGEAKKLIEQGEAKICEVAVHVGYNSVSHFIQSFKKVYNVTPEQLKKAMK